jgi:hypothetical protein
VELRILTARFFRKSALMENFSWATRGLNSSCSKKAVTLHSQSSGRLRCLRFYVAEFAVAVEIIKAEWLL